VLALEPQIIAWSERFSMKEHALFLGRGLHYPIALEGALKLKEISYIHAEAYPAGELKHGPLALVDARMPVVAIAPRGALAAKLKMPKAVRAVGHANGSNPISVVLPCHRLIGANGSLVKYGGGLERKRWLLQHEGARIQKKGDGSIKRLGGVLEDPSQV